MSQKTEIFENEEASKLLDYFVAYKKLLSKVEYIKCISVLNNQAHFSQTSADETNELTKTLSSQPDLTLTALIEK